MAQLSGNMNYMVQLSNNIFGKTQFSDNIICMTELSGIIISREQLAGNINCMAQLSIWQYNLMKHHPGSIICIVKFYGNTIYIRQLSGITI